MRLKGTKRAKNKIDTQTPCLTLGMMVDGVAIFVLHTHTLSFFPSLSLSLTHTVPSVSPSASLPAGGTDSDALDMLVLKNHNNFLAGNISMYQWLIMAFHGWHLIFVRTWVSGRRHINYILCLDRSASNQVESMEQLQSNTPFTICVFASTHL
jgi:hypothetical protein